MSYISVKRNSTTLHAIRCSFPLKIHFGLLWLNSPIEIATCTFDHYVFCFCLIFSSDCNYLVMQRNYRFFFMFVSSSTLLCIYVFSMSALYIKILMDDHQGTVWKAMKESPAAVVLMTYCFISLWFVGGLTGFHLYLIGSNQVSQTLWDYIFNLR